VLPLFRVDCSMCPLAVEAKNTHGDSPPRRRSNTSRARSESGISRLSFTVFPCGT
jgi:hypothetical protein